MINSMSEGRRGAVDFSVAISLHQRQSSNQLEQLNENYMKHT